MIEYVRHVRKGDVYHGSATLMIQRKKLETAVLVGVHAQSYHQYNFESTMEELEALALTCQLDVKGKSLKIKSDYKYYVGKGKIDEIKAFIEFNDIDVVVTNDELTTAQSKTLNDNLGIKIIDRTQLILENAK